MARILVIDDEEMLRLIIRAMLEPLGHQVVDAADGSTGVQLYRQHPADIVIVDFLIPGKDGIEVLKDLRADFPDVKIIAMTGHDPDILPLAVRMGASHTLKKPFRMDKLLDAIQELTED